MFHRCRSMGWLVIAAALAGLSACQQPIQGRKEALQDWSRYFANAAVTDGPKVVDCTLSGGTRTQCLSITVEAEPKGHSRGPWCPRNVADGPAASGIWLDGGKVYDADGAFLAALGTF